MSDANLRALERAAQSGDPEAIERWLAERRRMGQKLTNRVWTTRDGTRIKVVALSNSHLKNVLAYLQRTLVSHPRRWTDRTQRLFNALLREARQRGVDWK